MKAKIKWYQEVLELEPSSKVFFPLAKLFADAGQHAEAVATLRQGLERHPEHFEARMLLIDCLGSLGVADSLEQEISRIGGVLSKYPSFWKNWASTVASQPDGTDAALALSFLSATFDETSISWSTVIEQGLRSVLSGSEGVAVAPKPATVHHMRPAEPVTAAMPDDEPDNDEEDALDTPRPRSHAHFTEAETAAHGGADFSGDEDGDNDEPFSLRTLTMARVLAEQGDIKGALDICKELDETVQTEAARQRVEEFRTALTSAPKPGQDGAETREEGQPLQGKTKLINTLESLAERLEARAAR